MNGYYREKVHVNHFWELKSNLIEILNAIKNEKMFVAVKEKTVISATIMIIAVKSQFRYWHGL